MIFVALLIGVGLVQLPEAKARPLLDFFDSATALVLRLVDLVMWIAPLGVFSLIASTITSVAGDDPGRIAQLMGALGYYCIAVVLGLAIQTLVTYPVLLKLFTPMPIRTFFSGIAPAQLVAFSTSSSGATLPVTMDDMIRHTQAVRRGAPTAFVIGDMPYMTYQPSVEAAIRNAGRFMAEAACDAVKLEGGVHVQETIRAIVDMDIPVMGHVGFTPQSVHRMGGYRVQGREEEQGEQPRHAGNDFAYSSHASRITRCTNSSGTASSDSSESMTDTCRPGLTLCSGV